MGGFGLKVDEAFDGDPAHVRAWLKHGAERLNGKAAMSAGTSP
jgi:hypothetical protein